MAQFDSSDIGSWTGTGAVVLYNGQFRIRWNRLTHDSNGKSIPTVEHNKPGNLDCASSPPGFGHNARGARRCTMDCSPIIWLPHSQYTRSAWCVTGDAQHPQFGEMRDVARTAWHSANTRYRFHRYSERSSVIWPVSATTPDPTPAPAQDTPAPVSTPDPYAFRQYAIDGWATFVNVVEMVATMAALQVAAQTRGTQTAQSVKRNTLDWLTLYVKARRPDGSPINPMMVGPAGCGKTTIARMLAESLALPFYVLSLNRDSTPETIMGQMMPVGGNEPWQFTHTPFTTAYTNGGVILLDEFDAADANTATALHLPLANGHAVINGALVARHPDCYILAACNTYGSGSRVYVGREELDEATLSRFTTLSVDYDPDYEGEIIAQCADDARATLSTFLANVRKAINLGKLHRTFSTRHLIDWVSLVNVGVPMEHLAAEYFAAWDSNNIRTARDHGVPMVPVESVATTR